MKKQKGFTLIELLVVISIIALLLSILIPSLKAAKSQAQKVICSTRTRSIGTAVLLYTQDHDGLLPQPGEWGIPNNGFDSSKKDYGIDSATEYYNYHGATKDGVTAIGYLYKAGILDHDEGDLVFCPSTKSFFGNNVPTKNFDSKGDSSHWNFIGSPSYGGGTNKKFESPKHDSLNLWFNQRITIGTRLLGIQRDKRKYGFFKIESASIKGKRAFLSDIWCVDDEPKFGNYYKTIREDIPHKSGKRRSINVWYLDGSAKSVKINEERYNAQDRLNKETTWSNMLDNAY